MSDSRPELTLALFVGLCVISLLTGTRAGFIGDGLRQAVAVTTYPFVKAMDYTERGTNYVFDFVLAHERMRIDNDSMRKDIAIYKTGLARVRELREENARLRGLLTFERDEPRLSLKPAKVLESYKGILKIDRGYSHGIEKSMGVITNHGVVGIVIEAGIFTSTVATLHHVDCRIGAMVQRNRLRAYDGIIHAGGSNLSLYCTMEYIDLKDDVRTGDLVVTSPESLFPSGYPIGVVTAIHGSGTLWKSAELRPAVDPYRLDEVFVITGSSPSSSELAGYPGDGPPSEPARLPENTLEKEIAVMKVESLQERYAP
jgi:rod shape-determining protein MreC